MTNISLNKQEIDMLPIRIPIDPSFFEEEESYGFTVSKERKKLWAIELDLLAHLDSICRIHNLKYCVGAGTMLGAVRHKGFIPWDDDIDIYMLRKDYDKLVALSNEFEFPYFLQNSYTEKNLLKSFSRLRNSLTTGYPQYDKELQINKGIFVDIFPLDGISTSRLADSIQYFQYRRYVKKFGIYGHVMSGLDNAPCNGFIEKIKRMRRQFLVNHIIGDKFKFFQSFEKTLKRYSVDGTELWGNRTIVFRCPKSRRPIEDYMNTVNMPFEFLEVPVPRNYDVMLRQQYGDYMKIPENKGVNMHGVLTISTEYAYNDSRRIEKP